MKYIAYPETNVVIVADDSATPHAGGLEFPFEPFVKAVWNGTAVVEGATQQELDASLAAVKLAAESEIDDAENVYFDSIFGGSVKGVRAYEYMLSVLEAAAVLAQSTVPQITGDAKNVLASKAAQRATTEAAEAQIVWDKFMQFKDILGNMSGIRTRNKDAKNAATTKAGVAAAVAQYHTDMQAFIASLQ